MMAALPTSAWIRMYAAIKDTHPTFSGYSIAIPEVGHRSRRPRPTRTWPGSALAERDHVETGPVDGRRRRRLTHRVRRHRKRRGSGEPPRSPRRPCRRPARGWYTVGGEVRGGSHDEGVPAT